MQKKTSKVSAILSTGLWVCLTAWAQKRKRQLHLCENNTSKQMMFEWMHGLEILVCCICFVKSLPHPPKAVHLVSWSTALLDMLYARTPGNYKTVIKRPNECIMKSTDTK